MSFEKVKYNYEEGFWSKQQVKMAVRKGIISKEQYKTITGEKYA